MKITYKGVTTEVSNNLLDPPIIRKNKPKKSYKFGSLSLYYDGQYYFPNDIKRSDKRPGKPYEIQVVFYSGKWRQDTAYITEELKNLLTEHSL